MMVQTLACTWRNRCRRASSGWRRTRRGRGRDQRRVGVVVLRKDQLRGHVLGSGCESVEKGVLDILNCGAVAPKLASLREPA